MSALTGGRRDRNDRGIMEYCSGQSCNTLTVFGFQSLVSPRNREALLPPPLHAAAELIKTPTFNKTPHYHNNKKTATPPWASVCMHPEWVLFLQDAGPADFQTPIMRLAYVCTVCVYSPWPICRLFSSRHFCLQTCLFSNTNISMKTNGSRCRHNV